MTLDVTPDEMLKRLHAAGVEILGCQVKNFRLGWEDALNGCDPEPYMDQEEWEDDEDCELELNELDGLSGERDWYDVSYLSGYNICRGLLLKKIRDQLKLEFRR